MNTSVSGEEAGVRVMQDGGQCGKSYCKIREERRDTAGNALTADLICARKKREKCEEKYEN